MIYLFVFLFGIIIGSFFNVYATRRLEGESLLWPPSHCDHCKRKLDLLQLLPVLGFLLQKGNCRYCGEKIPFEYTAFEIFHGVLAFYLIINYPLVEGVLYFFIISILVAMGRIDYRTGYVYLVDLLIISILFILQGWVRNTSIVKTILCIGLFLLSCFYLKKEKYLGTGDISVFILIGMNMSFFEGVGFFLLFSLMGGIVGILLLIRGRSRKDEIPLVPIIAAAYIFYLPLSMPIYYFLGWSL